jgi:hypothetical protein
MQAIQIIQKLEEELLISLPTFEHTIAMDVVVNVLALEGQNNRKCML